MSGALNIVTDSLIVSIILAISLMCLPLQTAYADRLACIDDTANSSESRSFYCNDTWQGGKQFYRLIASHYDRTEYSAVIPMNPMPAEEDASLVFIWINPSAEISSQNVIELLQSGIHLIVFDDTFSSVMWFNDLISPHAIMQTRTYRSRSAYHINGSSALPVYLISKEERENAGFFGRDVRPWRLAFNHPHPIVSHTSQPLFGLDSHFFYTYTPEAQPEKRPPGTLFVIRDASFPIRLMINTFENSTFVQSLLQRECQRDRRCRIILFEPSAPVSHPAEEHAETGWAEETIAAIQSFADKVSNAAEDKNSLISSIPWKVFFAAVLTAWTALGIILVFPLRRLTK